MKQVKETVEVIDKIMERMKIDREAFIDQVAVWWCKELSDNESSESVLDEITKKSLGVKDCQVWQKESDLRRKMFLELRFENLENVCRHGKLPIEEFKDFEERVLRLRSMQLLAGVSNPHPSLWREYAVGAMRAEKWTKAKELLEYCIENLTADQDVQRLRDLVLVYCDMARCLLNSDDLAGAKDYSSKAISAARKLDESEEKAAYEKFEIGYDFRPSLLHAYFHMMDIIISMPDWKENQDLQKDFTYYWQESLKKFDTPKKWLPPHKLIVISDPLWRERVPFYVRNVTKDLYRSMPKSVLFRTLRTVRSTWWDVIDNTNFKVGASQSQVAATVLTALGTMILISSEAQGESERYGFELANYTEVPASDAFEAFENKKSDFHWVDAKLVEETRSELKRVPKATIGEILNLDLSKPLAPLKGGGGESLSFRDMRGMLAQKAGPGESPESEKEKSQKMGFSDTRGMSSFLARANFDTRGL